MTSGGEIGNLVRRVVVPQLHRLPGLRDRILDGETPALHRSALVHKSRAPRGLAGTLCPNPEVTDGTRLDDVLGTGFAIVSAAVPNPAERTHIARRGAVLYTVTPDSELAQWLRRGHATAAVIRPDRTVMHAGRRLSELCDALPRNEAAPLPNSVGWRRPVHAYAMLGRASGRRLVRSKGGTMQTASMRRSIAAPIDEVFD
jgi:3-(3-hydroxy-phenyl)propionate hydroxylase